MGAIKKFKILRTICMLFVLRRLVYAINKLKGLQKRCLVFVLFPNLLFFFWLLRYLQGVSTTMRYVGGNWTLPI